MLKVHSIETFGTQDGPGIRLVIFVQGCQFKCLYCHNPDTQQPPREGGREISQEEILELLKRLSPYMKNGGGLTISGGEPTLQAGEIIKIFKAVREAGFETALDTNGGIFNDQVKELLEVTDLLLLDVKQINEVKHLALTGKSVKTTLETAAWREVSGKRMWLRYVLVPGYSDDEDDVRAWASFFGQYKNVEKVEILPFHQMGESKYQDLAWEYKLKGVLPPDEPMKKRTLEIMKEYFGGVEVIVK